MKTLFVLVILSGDPGPTWTVSTPVTEETCKVMHQAVLDAATQFNGGSSGFITRVHKPRDIRCQRLRAEVPSLD